LGGKNVNSLRTKFDEIVPKDAIVALRNTTGKRNFGGHPLWENILNEHDTTRLEVQFKPIIPEEAEYLFYSKA
jgi:hypothetical protein